MYPVGSHTYGETKLATWESFTSLSGDGELTFTLSGVVQRVRIDITDTGQANQADLSTTFPRWFKLGWWTFTDNTHGLGLATLEPVYFIDFIHGWYLPSDGVNFFAGGFNGIHYHFYDGVLADIFAEET